MELQDFFRAHPSAALAFSGGADSAYLLAAALRSGADVQPYIAVTPFQPAFELEDARRLCGELHSTLREIPIPLLREAEIAENTPRRCYFCKTKLLSAIQMQAERDGYSLLLDGTNASDRGDERPGMQALAERGVLSPLRLCELDKTEIRRRSREMGLSTWDKPAYACLATRIPTGEEITAEKLSRIEQAENRLTELGYRDFRVRFFHGAARLQLAAGQQQRVVSEAEALREALKPWFTTVLLDLEAR